MGKRIGSCHHPAKANSGRELTRASQANLIVGSGSVAYSAKLLAGTAKAVVSDSARRASCERGGIADVCYRCAGSSLCSRQITSRIITTSRPPEPTLRMTSANSSHKRVRVRRQPSR